MLRDISLHVADIIQNSIAAKSSKIEIVLSCDEARKMLFVIISDDGKGMSESAIKKVEDPFYTTRTTRKVGLGIPFFKMSSELAGGNFSIESKEGEGTKVCASFLINHIDRLPLGSIGDTIFESLLTESKVDFQIVLDNKKDRIVISTKEIASHFGVSCLSELQDIQVLIWVKEYINENVKRIFKGILHELV